jgi:hypothetical protein
LSVAEKLLPERTKGLLASIARLMSRTGVSPNLLTLTGFLGTLGVAYILALGYERTGGLLMIRVGLPDALIMIQGRACV